MKFHIMSEWKTYKLGDLIECIIDNRGKSAPISISNYQPIIEINALGQREVNYDVIRKYVSKETYDTWFRAGHPKIGDILFSTVGTIGLTSLMTQDLGCIAQNIIALRVNDKLLNNLYLYYFLNNKTTKINLNNLNIGGVQPSIKLPHLLNMPISLPPLAEQKRIADILSAIDDKIELNRRINANLEQQAQALYKSWFVDNKKDDWEEGVASDYFNITIGKTPPRKETKWFSTSNKDHVWISISDMGKHGMYLGQSSEYLTQSAIEKFNIVIVPDKTVLLSFKLTIGRVVISDGNVTTNEAIAHFNTNDQNLLEYTYLSLKNYEFAALGSTSSIASAVNSKTIKSMRWIMPNRDLINQFHEKVGPLFNMIRQNEKEINHLSTLRDTLLPKLMSGEITV